MVVAKQNVFSEHDVNLTMPLTGEANFLGWIRLSEGGKDAGYVYVISPPVKPRVSSRSGYIVTSIAPAMLQPLLDVLRHEPNLQIRFYDPEVAGSIPSVFIEPRAVKAAQDGRFNASDEVAEELEQLVPNT